MILLYTFHQNVIQMAIRSQQDLQTFLIEEILLHINHFPRKLFLVLHIRRLMYEQFFGKIE